MFHKKIGRDGKLNKSIVMFKEKRTSFLGSYKRDEKLDDETFNVWKTELLKELPSFWESMSGKRN